MKMFIWLLRFAVFIILFGLAVKNSAPVDLRFYLDHHIETRLSLVLLVTFAIGVAVGVTAAFSTMVKQRRELNRLRSAGGSHKGA
jgi:lipopolysaccharide assembly protein A